MDQEPNSHHLGHPLNSFHLVKHVAVGWHHFENYVIPNLDKMRATLDKVSERRERMLPDDYDIVGAAFGVARLVAKYDVDVREFVDNGVIKAKIGIQDVISQPSALKPSGIYAQTNIYFLPGR